MKKGGYTVCLLYTSIADAIHHKIKGSDVLQETESAENTLKQLNDDTGQDVVFSLVTCVDRAGRTFKYNYNTCLLYTSRCV